MMAESRLKNAVDELLTCAFCLEEANNPKSLSCQHTFCLRCLKQCIEINHISERIKCPTCRQWSNLPRGGPDRLGVNFLFTQLKDAANEHVTHRTLTDGASFSSSGSEGRHCDKHPDVVIQAYCETCDQFMCFECCLSSHSRHTWEKLAAKLAKSKAKLKEVLQQVHIVMTKVKATEHAMKQKTIKVDKDEDQVKQKRYRVLADLEASINNDVDQACHQTRKQLKAESDTLSVTLATLESIQLCGEKLLQHGNPADYMMTVPVLVKQLHDNNPDKMTYLMDDVDLTSVEEEIEAIKVIMTNLVTLQR